MSEKLIKAYSDFRNPRGTVNEFSAALTAELTSSNRGHTAAREICSEHMRCFIKGLDGSDSLIDEALQVALWEVETSLPSLRRLRMRWVDYINIVFRGLVSSCSLLFVANLLLISFSRAFSPYVPFALALFLVVWATFSVCGILEAAERSDSESRRTALQVMRTVKSATVLALGRYVAAFKR